MPLVSSFPILKSLSKNRFEGLLYRNQGNLNQLLGNEKIGYMIEEIYTWPLIAPMRF